MSVGARAAGCACGSRARSRASASGPSSSGSPTELGLAGWVLNDSRGVLVEVEGETEALDRFLARLRTEAPPLASSSGSSRRSARARRRGRAFGSSRASAGGEPAARGLARRRDLRGLPGRAASTRRTAATAIRSSTAPTAARGSRSSRGVPYDRPLTTMAGFEMCAACRAEYDDPLDRRFHAQPNACPRLRPARCGSLDADGGRSPRRRRSRSAAAALLARARSSRSRASAASTSPAAPTTRRPSPTLRARKHREDKPFALMAPDVEAARGAGRADATAEALLLSAASARSCSRRGAADARVAAVGRAGRAASSA